MKNGLLLVVVDAADTQRRLFNLFAQDPPWLQVTIDLREPDPASCPMDPSVAFPHRPLQ